MRFRNIIFGTVLVFLFSSCSIQQIAIKSMTGIMDSGLESILEESDLRVAEISMISNLKLIETFIKADPQNERLLLLASMGYGSYALGYLEDTFPIRAGNLYFRAKEYGMRILRMNKDFANAEKGSLNELENTLKQFSKDDVPALFWSAYNWGSYINLNINDLDAVSDLSKVNAMMQRVIDLDESYYFGGAYLYFASMYSKVPKALGGNPEKSKEDFEKALKINEGKFLMSYVYYAKMYAVAVQDRELFTSLLKKVTDAPPDILPKQILPNMIAKQKAKYLLENIENYF